MKKRLEKSKGAWADELPGVLWSYRTTARSSTGQTPFSLVFGCEAVIPAEGVVQTPRYQWLNNDANQQLMSYNLDTVDELIEQASIRLAAHQQKMAKYFNKNVRSRTLKKETGFYEKFFRIPKKSRTES